jgi:peptide/nickel transport system substrate-binding protein
MRRIALTLIIALLALPAIAMAKADLVVVTDAPPKSMNPHAFSSDANLSYMSNFFDGLLQRPAPDGKLSPALAESWERLDGVTWKFWLRKGVKFHNGNAFDRRRRQIHLRAHERSQVLEAAEHRQFHRQN